MRYVRAPNAPAWTGFAALCALAAVFLVTLALLPATRTPRERVERAWRGEHGAPADVPVNIVGDVDAPGFNVVVAGSGGDGAAREAYFLADGALVGTDRRWVPESPPLFWQTGAPVWSR